MGSITNSKNVKLIEPEQVDNCDIFKKAKSTSESQECFVEFDTLDTQKLTIHIEDLVNILKEFNSIDDVEFTNK